MLWRYAKVFMVIFASCELIGIGTVAFSKPERAIWSTMALVDGNARNAFLSAVTKFADKEAFAIRTSQPRDDGTHFLVQMWRDDVNIVILNPLDDPTQFNCFFYQTGALPVPDVIVDDLAKHLRGQLGLIPGVVFKDDN